MIKKNIYTCQIKAMKVKKKKKYDEGEQLAMEQVKEMKKLENFLFGSLYSPLEFGKEEDEVEPPKAAEKVSDLFFTDRSADSVLTVYREEDADLSEGSHDDDDRALQKKPVWVDDEEENATVNIAKVNRLRKLRKIWFIF